MTFSTKTAPEFSLRETDALADAFEIAGQTLGIEYDSDASMRSKLRTLITHIGRGRLRLGINIADAFEIRAMSSDAVDFIRAIKRLAVDDDEGGAGVATP